MWEEEERVGAGAWGCARGAVWELGLGAGARCGGAHILSSSGLLPRQFAAKKSVKLCRACLGLGLELGLGLGLEFC